MNNKDHQNVPQRRDVSQQGVVANNPEKTKFKFRSILLTLSVIAFMIIIAFFKKEPEDKANPVIYRHYSEVIKEAENEPKDITSCKYRANIPKIVQEDIKQMLEMHKEDARVVYNNDYGDKIIIEPSRDSEIGYKVRFQREFYKEYSSMEDIELESNVSFYKSNDRLVIYGGEIGERTVSKYYMDHGKMYYGLLNNEYVDLYGTKEYDNCDNIREHTSSYATLIRRNTEFSFYYLGKKVYTTNFEGGEISDWSYYYLTTTSKDCYNVYYNRNPNDYWIKFCKVAENVDQILEAEKITIIDEDSNEMYFPIFRIGNKKYAQIPNAMAERTYGQNYGRKYGSREDKIDFTSELVEISSLNSSKVKLEKYSRICDDDGFGWILRYYFQEADRECFLEKRINGLDTVVSKLIPEKEIEKFAGKVISSGQVKKYINQLKSLYDEYTDNEF